VDFLRGDLIEAAHHAEHELAVGELDRGRVRRVAERDGRGVRGHLLEDRVDGGLAEGADVGDRRPLREQGIGHDRAVAAERVEAGVELEVGALAGGGGDALAELGDGPDGREILALAGAQRHGRHDGVDEAVEAHQGALAQPGGAVFAELLQRAGLEVHGRMR